MFKKEEYQAYFKSILQKEVDMAKFLEKAIAKFNNQDIIQTLNKQLEDEKHHVELAKKLIEYL